MNRIVAALTIVAVLGGCSFIAVRRPSRQRADCTSSRRAPIGDSLLTVAAIATALVGLFGLVVVDPDDTGLKALAAVGSVSTVVFGVSAGYGFYETGKCRESNAARLSPPDATPASAPSSAP
jgi:hypothetical protein